jgi:hypothetical protein
MQVHDAISSTCCAQQRRWWHDIVSRRPIDAVISMQAAA